MSSIPDPVYNVAKLDVSEQKASATSTSAAPVEGKEASLSKLANDAISTSASSTHPVAAAIATAATGLSDNSPISTQSKPKTPEATKEATPAESPEKKETATKEAVEEEEEEEEESPAHDENEFKLNVLKEQEELIKKEEAEAKLRSQRDVVEDDISLDENEDTPEQTSETKQIKENNDLENISVDSKGEN